MGERRKHQAKPPREGDPVGVGLRSVPEVLQRYWLITQDNPYFEEDVKSVRPQHHQGKAMSSNKMRVGSSVRVSPTAKHQGGSTGVILEPRGAPENGSSRRWLVRFDWPLGGMGSYAEVSEDDLELLQNMPNKGELRL